MTTPDPAVPADQAPFPLREVAGLVMLGAGSSGLIAVAFVIHALLGAALISAALTAAGLVLATREV